MKGETVRVHIEHDTFKYGAAKYDDYQWTVCIMREEPKRARVTVMERFADRAGALAYADGFLGAIA